MSENTKDFLVWVVGIIAAATVVLGFTGCNHYNTKVEEERKVAIVGAINELVEKGHDPLEARCAIVGGPSEVCQQIAMKKSFMAAKQENFDHE